MNTMLQMVENGNISQAGLHVCTMRCPQGSAGKTKASVIDQLENSRKKLTQSLAQR